MYLVAMKVAMKDHYWVDKMVDKMVERMVERMVCRLVVYSAVRSGQLKAAVLAGVVWYMLYMVYGHSICYML